MDLIKWFIWYCHNIVDKEWFNAFYVTSSHDYIEEEFKSFRKSSNSWYADLDKSDQQKFIDLVINHYSK